MSAPQGAPHWVPRFLEAMAAERGAAGNTLAAYARDLSHAADWLTDQGRGFDSATQDDIEA
jgi:integrase/recombinase XerD